MTVKYYFDIGSLVQIQVDSKLASTHWLNHYAVDSISEPDITIQFVEHIPETVCYITLHETGITNDSFVFFTKDFPAKKVLVRFEELGTGITIICEKDVRQIPYLDMLIHSVVLIKQGLPLHASAFYDRGKIWLTSGYPQGGKTSVLLAFMSNGAKFISDDWAYITHDNHILGLQLPITLRHWQLQQLPALRTQVYTAKLSATVSAKALIDAMSRIIIRPKSLHRVIHKLRGKVIEKLYVTSHPKSVFKDQLMGNSGTVDRVLLSISHDDPNIVVKPVDTDIGIRQLLQMQQNEWHEFLVFIDTYMNLFPEKHNTYVGKLSQMLENQLHSCFKDTPFYCVYHPHPVDLHEMRNVIISTIE